MKVEQISIFIENKVGRLAEVTETLAQAKVNIKALSLADTTEFGILRLIVDKHEEAKVALKQKGFTIVTTKVVAAEVSHTPGGLHSILKMLGESQVNVEYMYGFPVIEKNAVMVFRFDKNEIAVDVLRKHGVRIVSSDEICK